MPSQTMQLDAKSTALVLIDLQKGVMARTTAPHSTAEVYERSMSLAKRFRDAGAVVVRVRVSFASDRADALHAPVDQPMDLASLPRGWDDFPEPVPSTDLVITKRHWGAFHGTELDLQMRRRGVRAIVLGGIVTNMGRCVSRPGPCSDRWCSWRYCMPVAGSRSSYRAGCSPSPTP